VLPVTREADGWHLADGARIAPAEAAPAALSGAAAEVLIPPAALTLAPPGTADLDARIRRSLFRGDGHLATLDLSGGHEIQLLLPQRPTPGDTLGLRLIPGALRWFPPSPTERTSR